MLLPVRTRDRAQQCQIFVSSCLSQKQNLTGNRSLAAHLARFRGHITGELASAAAISPRIAQLASSFPLLFTALVTGYGPEDNSARATELVIAGAPLSSVAAAMGLPLCLRHLPPEACPLSFSHVMWSPAASRLLASLIPSDPAIARVWPPGTSYAARYGDEPIAIWIARQHRLFGAGEKTPPLPHLLLPIVLYAWHSRHRPGLLLGWVPWMPSLELPEAFFRTVAWLKVIKPYVDLDPWGVDDPWLPEGRLGEYHFTPITSPIALRLEAIAMESCLIEYSEGIARNYCRLFSVEHAGQTVATMEVRPSETTVLPIFFQIKGVKNADCPVEIQHAAEQFVKQHARAITNTRLPGNAGRSHRLKGLLRHYCASMPAEMQQWVASMPFWHLQLCTITPGRTIGEKAPWMHWK